MSFFLPVRSATALAVLLAGPLSFNSSLSFASPLTSVDDGIRRLSGGLQFAQSRRSCKAAKDCRDAVILWCIEGYAGADRDNDGIPCESLCRSKAEVDEIRAEVGC